MSHEERLRVSFGESDENFFFSKLPITKNEDANTGTNINQHQGRGENQNYSKGNRGRRGGSRERGRGRFDKRNIQCYNCKRYGHFERDCRLKEGNNNKSVNYAQEGDEASPNIFFYLMKKLEMVLNMFGILDSRCSNHMSRNKELFSRMDESL